MWLSVGRVRRQRILERFCQIPRTRGIDNNRGIRANSELLQFENYLQFDLSLTAWNAFCRDMPWDAAL